MKTKDFFRYAVRPLNISILLCVLIFIIMFGEIMSVEIFKSIVWQNNPLPDKCGRQWDIHKSSKEFMPDGKILLTKHDKKLIIYDANYTQLWQGDKEDLPKKYQYLNWLQWSFTQNNFSIRDFIYAQKITPEMSKTLEIPVRQNDKITEIWRYLPDDDIFVGYEFKGEKIGYIGANGFGQLLTESKSFGKFDSLSVYVPKDSENPVLLWKTKNRFFAIDFARRKTEIIIDGGSEKISGIETKNWSYDGKAPTDANYRTTIKYSVKDAIHLMLNQPDEKITIKIPQPWNNYLGSKFRVTVTNETIFLYHLTSDILKPVVCNQSRKVRNKFNKTPPYNKAVNYSAELYKVDKAGSLSLINKFEWTKPEYIAPEEKNEEYYFKYATVVSPPVFYGANKMIENLPKDIDEIFPHNKTGMMRGYMELIRGIHPRNLPVCLILSFVMMLITAMHGWARKDNRLCLVLWLIFVGLFNIAGLLTYLALNHTPLIKCPVCGKSRGLEKPECIRCGAKFPEPKESAVINCPVT